ncbi:MAG: RluA family pseudouridine synthase [Anaerolineae bacterium]|nr:RluA family pseudouridine synthase [Anaerolineae bacterium]
MARDLSEDIRVLISDETEQRLDAFIATRITDLSRTRAQNLIRKGQVRVDSVVVEKNNFTLRLNARVEVTMPPVELAELSAEAIPLDVIYENNQLIVINKPAGMVVHPSVGHASGTLVNAVLSHAPDMAGVGGEVRPGIVHRLDKDTSGIIIIAKDDHTHRWFVEQFKSRRVHKKYLALVDGFPPTPTGRIETAIGRDPKKRKQMAVVPDTKGRLAVTDYVTVKTYQQHTLIEARPLTGRTHQIRVHLAFLGCPIVGDRVYGKKSPTIPLKRHFLHASEISFQLQGETEVMEFTAPLPEDLAAILEGLPDA